MGAPRTSVRTHIHPPFLPSRLTSQLVGKSWAAAVRGLPLTELSFVDSDPVAKYAWAIRRRPLLRTLSVCAKEEATLGLAQALMCSLPHKVRRRVCPAGSCCAWRRGARAFGERCAGLRGAAQGVVLVLAWGVGAWRCTGAVAARRLSQVLAPCLLPCRSWNMLCSGLPMAGGTPGQTRTPSRCCGASAWRARSARSGWCSWASCSTCRRCSCSSGRPRPASSASQPCFTQLVLRLCDEAVVAAPLTDLPTLRALCITAEGKGSAADLSAGAGPAGGASGAAPAPASSLQQAQLVIGRGNITVDFTLAPALCTLSVERQRLDLGEDEDEDALGVLLGADTLSAATALTRLSLGRPGTEPLSLEYPWVDQLLASALPSLCHLDVVGGAVPGCHPAAGIHAATAGAGPGASRALAAAGRGHAPVGRPPGAVAVRARPGRAAHAFGEAPAPAMLWAE